MDRTRKALAVKIYQVSVQRDTPYGEAYGQASTTDVSFTGQDQDTAPGMHDFYARRYTSASGRWISPDPAGLNAVDPANPQTWNRYAYVANNPLSMVDPLGEQAYEGCGPTTPLCYNSVGLSFILSSGWVDPFSLMQIQINTTAQTITTGYHWEWDGIHGDDEVKVPDTETVYDIDFNPVPQDGPNVNPDPPSIAANNGPTATIGPPKQWKPAKQPSALSNYVAFLGCYGASVMHTISDEEDGQGWTAYGFINAGAILAIKSGAVFTPVGYTFVATAGLMDLAAGVKANQECTAAIYH